VVTAKSDIRSPYIEVYVRAADMAPPTPQVAVTQPDAVAPPPGRAVITDQAPRVSTAPPPSPGLAMITDQTPRANIAPPALTTVPSRQSTGSSATRLEILAAPRSFEPVEPPANSPEEPRAEISVVREATSTVPPSRPPSAEKTLLVFRVLPQEASKPDRDQHPTVAAEENLPAEPADDPAQAPADPSQASHDGDAAAPSRGVTVLRFCIEEALAPPASESASQDFPKDSVIVVRFLFP
jgi:hypothetical protein